MSEKDTKEMQEAEYRKFRDNKLTEEMPDLWNRIDRELSLVIEEEKGSDKKRKRTRFVWSWVAYAGVAAAALFVILVPIGMLSLHKMGAMDVEYSNDLTNSADALGQPESGSASSGMAESQKGDMDFGASAECKEDGMASEGVSGQQEDNTNSAGSSASQPDNSKGEITPEDNLVSEGTTALQQGNGQEAVSEDVQKEESREDKLQNKPQNKPQDKPGEKPQNKPSKQKDTSEEKVENREEWAPIAKDEVYTFSDTAVACKVKLQKLKRGEGGHFKIDWEQIDSYTQQLLLEVFEDADAADYFVDPSMKLYVEHGEKYWVMIVEE